MLNFCLVAEIFFSYFRVGPLPLRVYFLIVFTFIGILSSLHSQRPWTFRLHPPVMFIFFFATMALGLQALDHFTPKFWHYMARGLGASLLIYILTSYALSERLTHARSAFLTLSIAVGVSSFFALLQAVGLESAWDIRHLAPVQLENEMSEALSIKSRPVGLSYTPIELGYQISTAFPLCWYLMATSAGAKKLWLKLLLAILFLGAIACQTRSALIAIILSVILMNPRTGRRHLTLKNATYVLLLAGVAAVLSTTLGLAERLFQLDESALGKAFLMYAGILYIGAHPLGSGILMKDFFQFKSGLLGGWAEYGGGVLAQVERYTPHNQFINTGVMYGVTGLIALLIFYVVILHRLASVPQISEKKLLATSISTSIVAYIVNSVVHNAGPFVGDPFSWYFIGMAGAIICSPTSAPHLNSTATTNEV